jgi:copper chaperone CopZ
MEKLQLSIPAMWADHHVLQVRDVLANLEGVQGVYASSTWKQVLLDFDGAKVNRATIESALAQAGFPTSDSGDTAYNAAHTVAPGFKGRDPGWEVLGARTTRTNRADVDMSGEFRRY